MNLARAAVLFPFDMGGLQAQLKKCCRGAYWENTNGAFIVIGTQNPLAEQWVLGPLFAVLQDIKPQFIPRSLLDAFGEVSLENHSCAVLMRVLPSAGQNAVHQSPPATLCVTSSRQGRICCRTLNNARRLAPEPISCKRQKGISGSTARAVVKSLQQAMQQVANFRSQTGDHAC